MKLCTDERATSTRSFGITTTTMSRLKSLPKPANAIACYALYADTAARQRTLTVYATDNFVARGLGWSPATLRRTKQQLRELGLIEVVAPRHRRDGTFTKPFVRLHHVDICRAVSAVLSPVAQTPVAQTTTCGEMSDKMLKDKNLNAGRRKEMLSPAGKSSSPNDSQPAVSKRLDEFLSRWGTAWLEFHGTGYIHQGRDTGRLAKLLAVCDLSPAALVKVARSAWARPGDFHCKRAADIAGFCEALNGIRKALPSGRAPGPDAVRSSRSNSSPPRQRGTSRKSNDSSARFTERATNPRERKCE